MTDLSPIPLTPKVNNPWREFIENVTEGKTYFRLREYGQLLNDLDRLYGKEEAFDALERSLAERDARIAEIEGRYKASHTIRAYLKAKLAAAEARNAELVKALEAEAPDHWPTDQQIGWDKCREHLRAALTEQPK